MPIDFISITDLQRNLKKVLGSKQSVRVVLSKNAVVGMVFSKEAAQRLMDSDVLRQIREEIWELNDPETRDLVIRSRKGLTKPVPFDTFAKKYGV